MTGQDLRVLILDTTIRGAFAAVASREATSGRFEMLSYCQRSVNRAAAAGVSDLVREVMQGSQLSWQDINHFTVGHGPGSFTGIKIGLAFAYGVKLARPELSVMGSSALSCLAEIRPGKLWFLPATRSQGYAAYSRHGEPAMHWVVDLVSSPQVHLRLLEANGRQPFDWHELGNPQFESILPWPLLEDAAIKYSQSLTPHWQLTAICSDIALSMAGQPFEKSLANGAQIPQPQYFRKSAPEEAFALKKGAST